MTLSESAYTRLGKLIFGLTIKETHVTFGRETSLIEGETFRLKVGWIYNQGRSVVNHSETFTDKALENMADPAVVIDAILNKLKAEVKRK